MLNLHLLQGRLGIVRCTHVALVYITLPEINVVQILQLNTTVTSSLDILPTVPCTHLPSTRNQSPV